MAKVQPAAKKRQVIASSNRTMFMWVAGMSAVIGACAVLSIFLYQQLAFKTTVTGKLSNTLNVLTENNKKSSQLMDNLRARNADAGLNAVKASPDDQALQVVLDALPADRNALALGSSLQQKLLTGISGMTVESMTVDAVEGGGTDVAVADEVVTDGEQQITLSFVATASDPNSLRDMLVRLEHSLRIIDIDALSLETSANKYTMTVTAHAYYKPAKTVSLIDEVVKPNEKK